MKGLIRMLYNTAKQTWHPIFYREAPLPGGIDNDSKLVRYKSMGHHTTGLATREEALKECNSIEERLPKIGIFTVIKELENDIEWNGEGIPIDVELRTT